MDCSLPGSEEPFSPWNFPGKSTGVGCHFLLQNISLSPFLGWGGGGKNTGVGCHPLLQGIFLTQVWNPGLPHCRQALYWQAVYSSGLYLEVRLYHLGTPGVYPASSPCPVSRVLCPCPTTTVCTCLHSGVTPWVFPKAYYEKLQHEACLTSCTVEVLIKL